MWMKILYFPNMGPVHHCSIVLTWFIWINPLSLPSDLCGAKLCVGEGGRGQWGGQAGGGWRPSGYHNRRKTLCRGKKCSSEPYLYLATAALLCLSWRSWTWWWWYFQTTWMSCQHSYKLLRLHQKSWIIWEVVRTTEISNEWQLLRKKKKKFKTCTARVRS